jgi:hypothetical protein
MTHHRCEPLFTYQIVLDVHLSLVGIFVFNTLELFAKIRRTLTKTGKNILVHKFKTQKNEKRPTFLKNCFHLSRKLLLIVNGIRQIQLVFGKTISASVKFWK